MARVRFTMPLSLLPVTVVEYPPDSFDNYPVRQEGAYDPNNSEMK